MRTKERITGRLAADRRRLRRPIARHGRDRAWRRQLQPEDVVARRHPHEVDMGAHDRTGALPVALQDGADDGIVLLVRPRQAIGDGELGAPERRDALPDADRRRQQELVVGAAIDHVVKLEIDRPVALGVVAANGIERAAVNELEVDPLGRRHALRRQPRARRLELAHDLEHLGQRRFRRQRHDHAAARPHLHQAGRGQLPQRLAHRRAGEPEAFGEPILVEPRARRIDPAQDVVRQPLADRFRQGGHACSRGPGHDPGRARIIPPPPRVARTPPMRHRSGSGGWRTCRPWESSASGGRPRDR